jgi:hypothetical protein
MWCDVPLIGGYTALNSWKEDVWYLCVAPLETVANQRKNDLFHHLTARCPFLLFCLPLNAYILVCRTHSPSSPSGTHVLRTGFFHIGGSLEPNHRNRCVHTYMYVHLLYLVPCPLAIVTTSLDTIIHENFCGKSAKWKIFFLSYFCFVTCTPLPTIHHPLEKTKGMKLSHILYVCSIVLEECRGRWRGFERVGLLGIKGS